MTTWAEARAAKRERDKREHRLYTVDKLGKPCPVCGHRVVAALGEATHPTCSSWEFGHHRA